MKFSILKRVMSYCKPYNRFFIAAIVSAVIQISLTLYGPILVGQAVDYMIGYRNVDILPFYRPFVFCPQPLWFLRSFNGLWHTAFIN